MCTAVGGDSQLTTRTVLNVQEPPQIIKSLQDVALRDGQEFTLDCTCKGNPKPTISWVFNGRVLDDDLRSRLEMSFVGGSNEKLTVRSPRKEMHEGVYQCFAENEIGVITQAARVSRSASSSADDYDTDDYVFKTSGRDEDYTFGQPSRPSHRPSGNGRNTNKRPGGKKVNCDKPRSEMTERERRRCPSREDTFELVEEDEEDEEENNRGNNYVVPEKPSVIRLSSDSAMVRWMVPDRRDGLNILFYKVQYKEQVAGQSTQWQTADEDIEPNARAFAVMGLKPEGKYRFRVAAVYENNDNAVSEMSDVFDFTKPPKGRKPALGPSITSVQAISPSALMIKWTFLASEEPNIQGFFVYFRSVSSAGGFTKDTVFSPNSRTHMITHLLPDHAYELKMQSFNDHGVSDFTPLFMNKTLKAPVKVTTMPPDDDGADESGGSNDDQTLYMVVVMGAILVVLLILVSAGVCVSRRRQVKPPANGVVKRRQGAQKGKERHPKAHSVHNLSHNGFMHDYSNPYGNYHKATVNGITSSTLSKSSLSTNGGFVFKDTTDDRHDMNIRVNPLQEENSYEGRSRTLSSTTFLGPRSMSTRDIMRRTCSISQHSLHNNANHASNVPNNIINGGIAPPNNNLNEPETVSTSNFSQHSQANGFVLNTIERGRRGRTSGHFQDEQHPNAFSNHAKINHRSSSFTRLNGTLERRRKSRTDLIGAVESGTLSRAERDECQPMLTTLQRCHGSGAGGSGSSNNGHPVIMQSSC